MKVFVKTLLFIIIINPNFILTDASALIKDKSRFNEDVKIIKNRTKEEISIWQGWKERYSVNLSEGIIIIDPFSEGVFSEAMGHALILSVQFNNQDYFDRIISGLKSYFKNKNGLYAWEISKTGAKIEDKNKLISASETELNVLMALLQASKLVDEGIWSENKVKYKEIADDLEEKMWENEVISYADKILFLPSDEKDNPYWPIVSNGRLSNIVKIAWAPTYFNPAYLKVFSRYYPNHDWKKLINNGYELSFSVLKKDAVLLENDKRIRGINPIAAWVWLKYDDKKEDLEIQNYFNRANGEGTFSNEYDSIRVPMYIGLDYFWNQDENSQEYMKRFLERAGVRNIPSAYVGAMPEYPKGWNNLLAISQYGVANKVLNNAQEFKYYVNSRINIKKACFGDDSQYYYNQTFILYGYLILNDRFVKIIR